MPLINFRTDLKSLQYGMDRPGGGASGLPYIKSPFPEDLATSTDPFSTLLGDFYNANSNTSDFPIRGGALNLNGPAGRPTTLAGQIDAARIKAFLDDPARGTIFKLKQTGLQLSNPNIQVSGVATTLGFDATKEILPYTRLYNKDAESTLTQVLLQGTGQHIPRHGLYPEYTSYFERTYESYVTKYNTPTSNRLSVLYQTKVAVDNPFTKNGTDARRNAAIGILDFSNKYSISPLGSQIYNYLGGPGSLYGVGFTIIKRATDTTQAAQAAATVNNAFTFTYQQLMQQNTTKGGTKDPNARQKIGARIQDFRAQLNTQTGEPGNYLVADYADVNQWYNPGLKGDQGATEFSSRVTYRDVNPTKVDKVNAMNPFAYAANSTDPWAAGGSEGTKDIIKFAFECLSNDYVGDAVALVFRAYLTSFTDNHSAEYNSFKYLGRGETFRTYQGFDRSVSFGFKIAAQSRAEMKPLYAKLNYLISQTYPDYSAKSKLMRAPVIQLTIGDYLFRVPGFLESVNITALNDAAWEIALDPTGLDSDINQVPQMIEVQCSFKPIHNFLPRRATLGDSSVPLIGKSDWSTTTTIGNMGTNQGAAERKADAAAALIVEAAAEKARQDEIDAQYQDYLIDRIASGATSEFPLVSLHRKGSSGYGKAFKGKKK